MDLPKEEAIEAFIAELWPFKPHVNLLSGSSYRRSLSPTVIVIIFVPFLSTPKMDNCQKGRVNFNNEKIIWKLNLMETKRKCPKCKTGYLEYRTKRGFFIKLLLFWLPIKRYRCNICWKKSHVFESPVKQLETV